MISIFRLLAFMSFAMLLCVQSPVHADQWRSSKWDNDLIIEREFRNNRSLRNVQIPITGLLDIRRSQFNNELQSLELRISPRAYQTRFFLRSGGRVIAEAISKPNGRFVTLVPYASVKAPRHLAVLSLEIDGRVRIRDVRASLFPRQFKRKSHIVRREIIPEFQYRQQQFRHQRGITKKNRRFVRKGVKHYRGRDGLYYHQRRKGSRFYRQDGLGGTIFYNDRRGLGGGITYRNSGTVLQFQFN